MNSDITEAQAESMDQALKRFQILAENKYMAGQKEHGGNLWEKPNLLDHAEEEVLDLWYYLQGIRQKLKDT
tara:strand:+ start:1678 stop:1890 length:213 start_codon:yes stop_codon:yes gene_type:complete